MHVLPESHLPVNATGGVGGADPHGSHHVLADNVRSILSRLPPDFDLEKAQGEPGAELGMYQKTEGERDKGQADSLGHLIYCG